MKTTNKNSVPINLCLVSWLFIVGCGYGVSLCAKETLSQSRTDGQQPRLKKLTPNQEKARSILSAMFTAEKRARANKELITLRKILASEAYTQFLKTEYPGDFKDFKEFVASPGEKVVEVKQICRKFISNASKRDIEMANADYWNMREVAAKMANAPREKRYAAMVEVLFNPNPNPKSEADMWWLNRFGLDFKTLNKFSVALMEMAAKDESTEKSITRKVMNRHGTDEGLLWLAVMDPKAVGRILKRFESSSTFIAWLTPADNREDKSQ